MTRPAQRCPRCQLRQPPAQRRARGEQALVVCELQAALGLGLAAEADLAGAVGRAIEHAGMGGKTEEISGHDVTAFSHHALSFIHREVPKLPRYSAKER